MFNEVHYLKEHYFVFIKPEANPALLTEYACPTRPDNCN